MSSSVPSKVSGEFTAQQMSAWLNASKYGSDRVVKVLVLGNSGAGKSFLCNATIGANTFSHATQCGRVTEVNTFVAVVIDGTAFVICNIPGLIESVEGNIPKNKAYIEAAFAFYGDCPTVALFVMHPKSGRINNEDYVAMRVVNKYVSLDPRATAVVINGVDWDELDQTPAVYRAKVISEVHELIERQLDVRFTDKLGKVVRSRYDSTEMTHLQIELASLLLSLRPVSMQPAPGAQLLLETEALKKDFAELHEQKTTQEANFRRLMDEKQADFQKLVTEVEQKHQETIAQMQQTIVALQQRPPTVIHVDGDDSSCVVM